MTQIITTNGGGGGGGGSGYVKGPEGATNGHIALFDGSTGKQIKEGGSIINNLTSTSATDVLSANQGRILKGMIDNLMAQGRFLSLWDCTTGLPISFPLDIPYSYHTGDYFMVETVDDNETPTNYRPSGSAYNETASSTVEEGEVAKGDYYVYDGSVWLLATNHGKTVSFANLAGQPTDNVNLATALGEKQDVLTAGTDLEIIPGGGEPDTVTGQGSVTLTNAVANGLNSVTLEGKTEQTLLPSGYTRIITTINDATASSKLDTGLMPNDGDEIEVHMSAAIGMSFYMFQSRAGSSGPIYGISGSTSGNTISADWGSTTTSGIARVSGHEIIAKASFINGVSTIYVKDITAGTEDTQTGTYDTSSNPTTNYYLRGNTGNYLSKSVPVYEIKVTNNGVKRLHYIPCTRDSDSAIGFYDLVAGEFITNEVWTSGGGTPSPTIPLDIITNNGKIVCSPNMFRTTGTSTTAGGTIFTVQDDGSVVCSGTATSYSSRPMGRAYVDSNMGNVTIEVQGVYGSPGNITVDRCQLFNSSGTALTSVSWSTWTRSATVDLSEYPTVSYINLSLKRSSNGAVNATVKVQVTKGTTTSTRRPYAQLRISGTVETVEDELGNTATAENLLSVGDYIDTQELISGVVNRKVGIMVLTGNESWSGNASNNYFSLAKSSITPAPIETSYGPLCTHLLGKSTYESEAGTIYFGTGYLNLNYNNEGGGSTSSARANFNSWLRNQYANGTPVIIVYPLATTTTETVTGQTLDVQEGDNTITITQASIDNLTISANYDALSGPVINFTNETGYQTVANMVTTLSGADNTHYPTAKAVADAIQSAGGGDMMASTYDPNNIGADAFDYTNFTNTPTIPSKTSDLNNDSGYITSSDLSGYQTTANLKTSLSDNSDSYYPSQKAVKTAVDGKQDALSSQTAYTSKGSATKVPQISTNSLGQVTSISEVTITQPDITGKQDKATSGSTAPSTTPTYVGQQYVDTTNDKLYVATGTSSSSDWTEVGSGGGGADVNTKTFYLSSTSDLTTAQSAYDWYLAGKNPIIVYNDVVYTYTYKASTTLKFQSAGYSVNDNASGDSSVTISKITFTLSGNTVSSVSGGSGANMSVLRTGKNYTTPYTPEYDGSPATKKYVDDSVSVVSGDSGTTYTIKVSNSAPASGTPNTTITFVV